MRKQKQQQEAKKSPASAEKSSPQTRPGENEQSGGRKSIQASQLPDSKATGPRSEAGKRRSSRNAIRYGIFSRVTVLPHESADAYDAHLLAFRVACDPQGGVEEFLVDKLASIAWRQRRILVAEYAEIRLGVELFERDFRNQQTQLAERNATVTDDPDPDPGLIWDIGNPVVLARCLEFLSEIELEIKHLGFEHPLVASHLLRIYGQDEHLRLTLYESYQRHAEVAGQLKENKDLSSLTPEECQKAFLSELSSEMRRLQEYQRQRVLLESDRMKLEVLRRNVPESAGLERLLKYGTSLDREFDRTMNRLERLQRMRAGLPVPPVVKVEVDS
jgi:hypothetical protein